MMRTEITFDFTGIAEVHHPCNKLEKIGSVLVERKGVYEIVRLRVLRGAPAYIVTPQWDGIIVVESKALRLFGCLMVAAWAGPPEPRK